MKKLVVSFVFLILFQLIVESQVIWSENFSSYGSCITTGSNLNTSNPAADWTTTFTDCDDGAITCTLGQSFWGTNGGQFRVNDIEGGPCTCTTGGTTQNFFTTESIDISGAAGVAISISVSHSGTFEAGTLGGCDNSEDIVHITYSIDGGPFTQVATNGFLTGNFGSVSSSQSCLYSGNTLVIRIQAGNKANDEHIFIDNLVVTETGCPPLPVELNSFNILCNDHNSIHAEWSTASEINNSHFILQGSKEGIYYVDMIRVEGNGNSNQLIEYATAIDNYNAYQYFRLIQYDFDGGSRNYDPVFKDCSSGNDHPLVISNNNGMEISLPQDLPGDTEVKLYGIDGKILLITQINNYKKGTIIYQTYPYQLASDIYILSVINEASGKRYFQKLFLQ